MRSRISRVIAPGAMVAAVSIALVLLHRELRSYHYRDLMRQVWTLPHSHLALALLLMRIGLHRNLARRRLDPSASGDRFKGVWRARTDFTLVVGSILETERS